MELEPITAPSRIVAPLKTTVQSRTGSSSWNTHACTRAARVFYRVVTKTIVIACLLLPCSWAAGDVLKLKTDAGITVVQGELILEAQDKSVLFRKRDGQLLIAQANEIESLKIVDEPTTALTSKEIERELLAELPPGFSVYRKGQYVIAYQTSISYAKWIAGLYEGRLQNAFRKYWKKKKLPLEKPEFPFVAIVFKSQAEYARYVQRELGSEPGTMVAYYSQMTNRVAMYDLTADFVVGNRPIGVVLQHPLAIPMVATVIHEGTHQLMFNTGMQVRFATDPPLWFNEGMATYFETPNLDNKKGWRLPGRVNPGRLGQFQLSLQMREADALKKLIGNNDQFNNPETSLAAYAEAWALNHFLLNRKPKEYVAYIKELSKKSRFKVDTPVERVEEFETHFGKIDTLDVEFLRYVNRLRY